MSLEEERRRLLQKPSLSTLDSEPELVGLDVIDSVIEPDEDPLDDPPPAPIPKPSVSVFCTEIPPPRMLRDNGYVNVSSTQLPKHVVLIKTFHQDQTTAGNPPSTLNLSSGSMPCSDRRSPSDRLSSEDTRSKDSVGSAKSHPTNSFTSFHSSPVSSRDMTLSTLDSLVPLSPIEPQPMTMQCDEEPAVAAVQSQFSSAPTSYFFLALCATLLCCLPVGLVAMVKAQQVHKRYNEGSLERARLASRQAKHWSAVAIVTGSIVWTVLAVTISVVLVLKLLAS